MLVGVDEVVIEGVADVVHLFLVEDLAPQQVVDTEHAAHQRKTWLSLEVYLFLHPIKILSEIVSKYTNRSRSVFSGNSSYNSFLTRPKKYFAISMLWSQNLRNNIINCSKYIPHGWCFVSSFFSTHPLKSPHPSYSCFPTSIEFAITISMSACPNSSSDAPHSFSYTSLLYASPPCTPAGTDRLLLYWSKFIVPSGVSRWAQGYCLFWPRSGWLGKGVAKT